LAKSVYLGIDIGTSGIRGCCIDDRNKEVVAHRIGFQQTRRQAGAVSEQNPDHWLDYFQQLVGNICQQLQALDAQLKAVCIDGTSSTLIACRRNGTPLSPALMYNDQQAAAQADLISSIAPSDCAAHGASSSLAKALLLLERYPDTELFCHQADWLAGHLSGNFAVSDENNCLKLGYDSTVQAWPDWLTDSENGMIDQRLLPRVVAPGTVIGSVSKEMADRFPLLADSVIVAGTTDSNAGVLATGASEPGDAVTSLGSTLVIKLFTEHPVFAPEFGVYSHHLNGQWLAGGASNSGGAVLLQQFTLEQIQAMTPILAPEKDTGLDYYPLPGTGERFPVCDPDKSGKISPRPDNDVIFFQALLEGMAQIEADAYRKLAQLGATPAKRIFTTGGGSQNPAWTKIRQRKTGLTVVAARHTEASYGSALLARQAVS
jgi:sugar (pentulose or hexulose) kinase